MVLSPWCDFLQRSFSPLMEAAESNHVEKVQVLIKQYGPELEIPTLVSSTVPILICMGYL